MATQLELLQFKIEALGNDQLSAMARDLVAVGKAGGDAAPLANTLLEKLAGIADQSAKATGLVSLKAQLQEVGDALFFAKSNAAQLQGQFDSTAAPTATLTRALDRANASVTSLDAQYNSLSATITANENALRAGGLSVENLDATERQLQTTLATTAAEAARVTAAHQQGSAAAKEEAVSIQSLSEKYGLFGKIVENVKTLLLTIGGFLALEKAKEELGDILATGDKFQKWGVDFANAFGGAEQGAEALSKVKDLAEEVPLSLEEVAAAALKAKKEGLDPFDGSLQALIDTNAKFGGGVDTLNTLIETLGRAYNKGALSTRELTQLQQQGIPVTQILGQQFGKTADEIEDMAKKGLIGRDSIKLLIDQLGASAAGDASRQMTLLGTLASKVKDQWEEFLNLIAKSGVYDFVQQKLQGINSALKAGIGDGTLKAKAQAIADAIVAIGNAASSAAKFVYDHAAAIGEAARAYIVFRTALLALDLAGAAARMGGLAAATRETAAAAAAAGAPNAGWFALGRAVRSIPNSIKIGIATVGIDIALSQIQKLLDVSEQYHQQVLDSNKAQDETIALREKLAARASVVAAQLKGYADTEIASADQLAGKTRAQSESYIAQLENATRYYTALKVQAQANLDFKGVEAASARLKELADAAEAARAHLKEALEAIRADVQTLIDRFDILKTGGESAASAIEGAFSKIEIQTPIGLNAVLDIVKQVSIRSLEAKDAVQTELAGALSKLNDADLRQFQQQVTQRLKDAKENADELKVALGAALQTELERLGLSAEQAGAKFTEGGQKIISTFADIASNANATGAQIQLAFAKALSQAQTQGEIDALKTKLQEAFDAGRIGAAQFQAGMEAAGRKLADVQVAAASASAELDGMGTAGTTAAQRISGALQDSVGKLEVQANQIAKAVNDALAAGDKVGAASLIAKLKVVEQEISSLNGKIQQLTPSYEEAGDAAQSFATKAEIASATQGRAAQNAALLADDAAEAASKAQRDYTEWGDSADKAAVQLGHATANTQHANDGMAALSQGIGDARAQFAAISPVAANFYDTVLKGNFEIGHSDDGSGFDRVARAMQAALQATTDEIQAERTQLQGVVDLTTRLGTESVEAFSKLGDRANYTSKQVDQMIASIQAGTYPVGILGQQDLAPLLAALQAAQQRMAALKAASEAANQSISDLGKQLQDERDQQLNDQTAIENRAYQDRVQQIQDLAAKADAAGKAQAQKDLELARQIHEQKLKDIADQQKQQSSGGGSAGATSTAPTPPPAPSPSSSAAAAVPAGLQPINIYVDGTKAAQVFGTQDQAQQLATAFVRQLANGRANSILG